MLTLPLLPLVLPFCTESTVAPRLDLESFSFTPDVATLLVSPPAASPAQGGWNFSYTYVEVGATRFNLDAIDDEADIFYGEASLDLLNLVNVFLNYESSSIDFANTDADTVRLGAGAHLGVAPNLDILGDIAWIYSDLSADTFSESSNGSQVRAGVRWLALPFTTGGIELAGRAIWINLNDSYFSNDSPVGFDVGARLHFLGHFSVGALYTRLDDDDSGTINARFSF